MANARNQLRLPASWANPGSDPAVVSKVAERTSFWNRLRLQQMCSESPAKAANSSAWRRAALARTRPQPGPFQQGYLLMSWRSDSAKRNLRARRRGPAWARASMATG
eukprot:5466858-Pyramimonas_sp.AAC.1